MAKNKTWVNAKLARLSINVMDAFYDNILQLQKTDWEINLLGKTFLRAGAFFKVHQLKRQRTRKKKTCCSYTKLTTFKTTIPFQVLLFSSLFCKVQSYKSLDKAGLLCTESGREHRGKGCTPWMILQVWSAIIISPFPVWWRCAGTSQMETLLPAPLPIAKTILLPKTHSHLLRRGFSHRLFLLKGCKLVQQI